MNIAEVTPTKSALFDFKGQLQFSIDGRSLLEEKREVLVMRLMDLIFKIKSERESLNKLLVEARRLLKIVRLQLGEYELEKIAGSIKKISKLIIYEKSIMGAQTYNIKYDKEYTKNNVNISFLTTNEDFDALSNITKEITNKIIKVAEIETSAWRLAYEIKKTQKRVNALENIYIPDFKDTIKFIQDTLEERDRETFFQMKKVKRAHQKSRNKKKGT